MQSNPCKWMHEERKVLWDCFVRRGGYIKKVKALWDEKSFECGGRAQFDITVEVH